MGRRAIGRPRRLPGGARRGARTVWRVEERNLAAWCRPGAREYPIPAATAAPARVDQRKQPVAICFAWCWGKTRCECDTRLACVRQTHETRPPGVTVWRGGTVAGRY